MDLEEVAGRFTTSMSHCVNLVSVHRGYGGAAAGRRAEEVSINRAVIVMTVAAWQAVIQDFTKAAIDAGAPAPGSPIAAQSYAVIQGRVMKEIADFSTPNAENSRRLLLGVGFDPRPHWTWQQRGGQGVGMITLHPHDVEAKLRDWLRLRHDVAHGHNVLSAVSVLKAVRENPAPAPGWSPTIRLVDAEACMAFFRRVSKLTATALAAHLGMPAGSWQ